MEWIAFKCDSPVVTVDRQLWEPIRKMAHNKETSRLTVFIWLDIEIGHEEVTLCYMISEIQTHKDCISFSFL